MSLASIVTNAVTSFLSEFVSEENLKQGEIDQLEWRNLRIFQRYLLEKYQLPLLISQGIIGRLSIRIPWNIFLSAETIEVMLENVYICVVSYPQSEWTSENATLAEIHRRQRAIDALNAVLATTADSGGNSKTSADASGGGRYIPGFIRRNLYTWLVSRLRVTFRDIHIRFESGMASCFPFSCGLCVPYLLTAPNAQQKELTQPTSTTQTSQLSRAKQVSFSLAIYYNAGDYTAASPSLETVVAPDLLRKNVLQTARTVSRDCSAQLPAFRLTTTPVVPRRLKVNLAGKPKFQSPRSQTKNDRQTRAEGFPDLTLTALNYIVPPTIIQANIQIPHLESGVHVGVDLPDVKLLFSLSTSYLQDILAVYSYVRQWKAYVYCMCEASAYAKHFSHLSKKTPKERWHYAFAAIQCQLNLRHITSSWYKPVVLRILKLHHEYIPLAKAHVNALRREKADGALRMSVLKLSNQLDRFTEDFTIPLPLLLLWRRQASGDNSIPREDLIRLGVIPFNRVTPTLLPTGPWVWVPSIAQKSIAVMEGAVGNVRRLAVQRFQEIVQVTDPQEKEKDAKWIGDSEKDGDDTTPDEAITKGEAELYALTQHRTTLFRVFFSQIVIRLAMSPARHPKLECLTSSIIYNTKFQFGPRQQCDSLILLFTQYLRRALRPSLPLWCWEVSPPGIDLEPSAELKSRNRYFDSQPLELTFTNCVLQSLHNNVRDSTAVVSSLSRISRINLEETFDSPVENFEQDKVAFVLNEDTVARCFSNKISCTVESFFLGFEGATEKRNNEEYFETGLFFSDGSVSTTHPKFCSVTSMDKLIRNFDAEYVQDEKQVYYNQENVQTVSTSCAEPGAMLNQAVYNAALSPKSSEYPPADCSNLFSELSCKEQSCDLAKKEETKINKTENAFPAISLIMEKRCFRLLLRRPVLQYSKIASRSLVKIVQACCFFPFQAFHTYTVVFSDWSFDIPPLQHLNYSCNACSGSALEQSLNQREGIKACFDEKQAYSPTDVQQHYQLESTLSKEETFYKETQNQKFVSSNYNVNPCDLHSKAPEDKSNAEITVWKIAIFEPIVVLHEKAIGKGLQQQSFALRDGYTSKVRSITGSSKTRLKNCDALILYCDKILLRLENGRCQFQGVRLPVNGVSAVVSELVLQAWKDFHLFLVYRKQLKNFNRILLQLSSEGNPCKSSPLFVPKQGSFADVPQNKQNTRSSPRKAAVSQNTGSGSASASSTDSVIRLPDLRHMQARIYPIVAISGNGSTSTHPDHTLYREGISQICNVEFANVQFFFEPPGLAVLIRIWDLWNVQRLSKLSRSQLSQKFLHYFSHHSRRSHRTMQKQRRYAFSQNRFEIASCANLQLIVRSMSAPFPFNIYGWRAADAKETVLRAGWVVLAEAAPATNSVVSSQKKNWKRFPLCPFWAEIVENVTPVQTKNRSLNYFWLYSTYPQFEPKPLAVFLPYKTTVTRDNVYLELICEYYLFFSKQYLRDTNSSIPLVGSQGQAIAFHFIPLATQQNFYNTRSKQMRSPRAFKASMLSRYWARSLALEKSDPPPELQPKTLSHCSMAMDVYVRRIVGTVARNLTDPKPVAPGLRLPSSTTERLILLDARSLFYRAERSKKSNNLSLFISDIRLVDVSPKSRGMVVLKPDPCYENFAGEFGGKTDHENGARQRRQQAATKRDASKSVSAAYVNTLELHNDKHQQHHTSPELQEFSATLETDGVSHDAGRDADVVSAFLIEDEDYDVDDPDFTFSGESVTSSDVSLNTSASVASRPDGNRQQTQLKYWMPNSFVRHVVREEQEEFQIGFAHKKFKVYSGMCQRRFWFFCSFDFTSHKCCCRLGAVEITLHPVFVQNMTTALVDLLSTVLEAASRRFVRNVATWLFLHSVTPSKVRPLRKKKNIPSKLVEARFSAKSITIALLQTSAVATEVGRVTLVGLRVKQSSSDVNVELKGFVLTGFTRTPILFGPWMPTPSDTVTGDKLEREKEESPSLSDSVESFTKKSLNRMTELCKSCFATLSISYDKTKVICVPESDNQVSSTPKTNFFCGPTVVKQTRQDCKASYPLLVSLIETPDNSTNRGSIKVNAEVMQARLRLSRSRLDIRFDELSLLVDFIRDFQVAASTIRYFPRLLEARMALPNGLNLANKNGFKLPSKAAKKRNESSVVAPLHLLDVCAYLPYLYLRDPEAEHLQPFPDNIETNPRCPVVVDLAASQLPPTPFKLTDFTDEVTKVSSLRHLISSTYFKEKSLSQTCSSANMNKTYGTHKCGYSQESMPNENAGAQTQQATRESETTDVRDEKLLSSTASETLSCPVRTSACVFYQVNYYIGQLFIRKKFAKQRSFDHPPLKKLSFFNMVHSNSVPNKKLPYVAITPEGYFPLSTLAMSTFCLWREIRPTSAVCMPHCTPSAHFDHLDLPSNQSLPIRGHKWGDSSIFLYATIKPFSGILHPGVWSSLQANMAVTLPVRRTQPLTPAPPPPQLLLKNERPTISGLSLKISARLGTSSSYFKQNGWVNTSYHPVSAQSVKNLRRSCSFSVVASALRRSSNPLAEKLQVLSSRPMANNATAILSCREQILDASYPKWQTSLTDKERSQLDDWETLSIVDTATGPMTSTVAPYPERPDFRYGNPALSDAALRKLLLLPFGDDETAEAPLWRSVEAIQKREDISVLGVLESCTLEITDAVGRSLFQAELLNAKVQHLGLLHHTGCSVQTFRLSESVSGTSVFLDEERERMLTPKPVLRFPEEKKDATQRCFSWVTGPVNGAAPFCVIGRCPTLTTVIRLSQPQVRLHPTVLGAIELLLQGHSVKQFASMRWSKSIQENQSVCSSSQKSYMMPSFAQPINSTDSLGATAAQPFAAAKKHHFSSSHLYKKNKLLSWPVFRFSDSVQPKSFHAEQGKTRKNFPSQTTFEASNIADVKRSSASSSAQPCAPNSQHSRKSSLRHALQRLSDGSQLNRTSRMDTCAAEQENFTPNVPQSETLEFIQARGQKFYREAEKAMQQSFYDKSVSFSKRRSARELAPDNSSLTSDIGPLDVLRLLGVFRYFVLPNTIAKETEEKVPFSELTVTETMHSYYFSTCDMLLQLIVPLTTNTACPFSDNGTLNLSASFAGSLTNRSLNITVTNPGQSSVCCSVVRSIETENHITTSDLSIGSASQQARPTTDSCQNDNYGFLFSKIEPRILMPGITVSVNYEKRNPVLCRLSEFFAQSAIGEPCLFVTNHDKQKYRQTVDSAIGSRVTVKRKTTKRNEEYESKKCSGMSDESRRCTAILVNAGLAETPSIPDSVVAKRDYIATDTETSNSTSYEPRTLLKTVRGCSFEGNKPSSTTREAMSKKSSNYTAQTDILDQMASGDERGESSSVGRLRLEDSSVNQKIENALPLTQRRRMGQTLSQLHFGKARSGIFYKKFNTRTLYLLWSPEKWLLSDLLEQEPHRIRVSVSRVTMALTSQDLRSFLRLIDWLDVRGDLDSKNDVVDLGYTPIASQEWKHKPLQMQTMMQMPDIAEFHAKSLCLWETEPAWHSEKVHSKTRYRSFMKNDNRKTYWIHKRLSSNLLERLPPVIVKSVPHSEPVKNFENPEMIMGRYHRYCRSQTNQDAYAGISYSSVTKNFAPNKWFADANLTLDGFTITVFVEEQDEEHSQGLFSTDCSITRASSYRWSVKHSEDLSKLPLWTNQRRHRSSNSVGTQESDSSSELPQLTFASGAPLLCFFAGPLHISGSHVKFLKAKDVVLHPLEIVTHKETVEPSSSEPYQDDAATPTHCFKSSEEKSAEKEPQKDSKALELADGQRWIMRILLQLRVFNSAAFTWEPLLAKNRFTVDYRQACQRITLTAATEPLDICLTTRQMYQFRHCIFLLKSRVFDGFRDWQKERRSFWRNRNFYWLGNTTLTSRSSDSEGASQTDTPLVLSSSSQSSTSKPASQAAEKLTNLSSTSFYKMLNMTFVGKDGGILRGVSKEGNVATPWPTKMDVVTDSPVVDYSNLPYIIDLLSLECVLINVDKCAERESELYWIAPKPAPLSRSMKIRVAFHNDSGLPVYLYFPSLCTGSELLNHPLQRKFFYVPPNVTVALDHVTLSRCAIGKSFALNTTDCLAGVLRQNSDKSIPPARPQHMPFCNSCSGPNLGCPVFFCQCHIYVLNKPYVGAEQQKTTCWQGRKRPVSQSSMYPQVLFQRSTNLSSITCCATAKQKAAQVGAGVFSSNTVYGCFSNVNLLAGWTSPKLLRRRSSTRGLQSMQTAANFLVLNSTSSVSYSASQLTFGAERPVRPTAVETDKCTVFTLSSSLVIKSCFPSPVNVAAFHPNVEDLNAVPVCTAVIADAGKTFALPPFLCRLGLSISVRPVQKQFAETLSLLSCASSKSTATQCPKPPKSDIPELCSGVSRGLGSWGNECKFLVQSEAYVTADQAADFTTANSSFSRSTSWQSINNVSSVDSQRTRTPTVVHDSLEWHVIKFEYSKCARKAPATENENKTPSLRSPKKVKRFVVAIISKIFLGRPHTADESELQRVIHSNTPAVLTTVTLKAPVYLFNGLPVPICATFFDQSFYLKSLSVRHRAPSYVTVPANSGVPITRCAAISTGLYGAFRIPCATQWTSLYKIWDALNSQTFPTYTCRVQRTNVVATESDSPTSRISEFTVVASLTLTPPPRGWYGSCGALTVCLTAKRVAVSRIPVKEVQFSCVCDEKSFNYVGDGRRIPFLLGQGVMRIGIRKTLVEKNGKHFLQHDDDATQVESIKSNTTAVSPSTLFESTVEKERRCIETTTEEKSLSICAEHSDSFDSDSLMNSLKPGTNIQLTPLQRIFCCIPTTHSQLCEMQSPAIVPRKKWMTNTAVKRHSKNAAHSACVSSTTCTFPRRSFLDETYAWSSPISIEPHIAEAQKHMSMRVGGWDVVICRHRVPSAHSLTLAESYSSLPIEMPSLSQLSLTLRGLPPGGFLAFLDVRAGGDCPTTFSLLGYRGPVTTKIVTQSNPNTRVAAGVSSKYDAWFTPDVHHRAEDSLFWYYCGGLCNTALVPRLQHEASTTPAKKACWHQQFHENRDAFGNITPITETCDNSIEVWEILPRYIVENRTGFDLDLVQHLSDHAAVDLESHHSAAADKNEKIPGLRATYNRATCTGCSPNEHDKEKQREDCESLKNAYSFGALVGVIRVHRVSSGTTAIFNFPREIKLEQDQQTPCLRLKLSAPSPASSTPLRRLNKNVKELTLSSSSEQAHPLQHKNPEQTLSSKVTSRDFPLFPVPNINDFSQPLPAIEKNTLFFYNPDLLKRHSKPAENLLSSKLEESIGSSKTTLAEHDNKLYDSTWSRPLPTVPIPQNAGQGIVAKADTLFLQQYINSIPLKCRNEATGKPTIAAVQYQPIIDEKTGITRLVFTPSTTVYYYMENHSLWTSFSVRQPKCRETQITVPPLTSAPFWFLFPPSKVQQRMRATGMTVSETATNVLEVSCLTGSKNEWKVLDIDQLLKSSEPMFVASNVGLRRRSVVHCRRITLSTIISFWDTDAARYGDLRCLLDRGVDCLPDDQVQLRVDVPKLDVSIVNSTRELFSFTVEQATIQGDLATHFSKLLRHDNSVFFFRAKALSLNHYFDDHKRVAQSTKCRTSAMRCDRLLCEHNALARFPAPRGYPVICSPWNASDNFVSSASTNEHYAVIVCVSTHFQKDCPSAEIPSRLTHCIGTVSAIDIRLAPCAVRFYVSSLLRDVELVCAACWSCNPLPVFSCRPPVRLSLAPFPRLPSLHLKSLSRSYETYLLAFAVPDSLDVERLYCSPCLINPFAIWFSGLEEILFERHMLPCSQRVERQPKWCSTACVRCSPSTPSCVLIPSWWWVQLLENAFFLLSIDEGQIYCEGFHLQNSVDFEINKTLFQLTPRTLQRLHRWLLKSGLSIVGNTNCFNNISGTLSKLSQGIKKTKKALRANTTCSRTAWDSCVAFLLLALQGVADQSYRVTTALSRTLTSCTCDPKFVHDVKHHSTIPHTFQLPLDQQQQQCGGLWHGFARGTSRFLTSCRSLFAVPCCACTPILFLLSLVFKPLVALFEWLAETADGLRLLTAYKLNYKTDEQMLTTLRDGSQPCTIRLPRMIYGMYGTVRRYSEVDAALCETLTRQAWSPHNACSKATDCYTFYSRLQSSLYPDMLVVTASRLLHLQLLSPAHQQLRLNVVFDTCLGSVAQLRLSFDGEPVHELQHWQHNGQFDVELPPSRFPCRCPSCRVLVNVEAKDIKDLPSFDYSTLLPVKAPLRTTECWPNDIYVQKEQATTVLEATVVFFSSEQDKILKSSIQVRGLQRREALRFMQELIIMKSCLAGGFE